MKNICKKIIGILLISILITSTNVALAVTESDINAQQQKKEENSNKQKELEKKQDEVHEIKDKTLKEVEELNSQITTYQGQISSLETQINEADTKIKQAEEELEQKQKEYEKKQETLQKRLVYIYEAGETSYLDVLLNASSLVDFISKYYLVSELTEMDTQLIEGLEKQKKEIEDSKKEIEESKEQLTATKANKESITKELKNTKSEKDSKVSQLSSEEQQIQKQIAEIQKDNIAIDKEIQSMRAKIEAARKAAEEEAKKNQNNNKGSTSGKSSAGFIRPVNSSITTGLYYSSGTYHGAVDFGASGVGGMPVYAVADGLVVTAKALTTSYGNYIILYHPSSNLYTLYAHGQPGSIAVSQGQTVKQGQQIMRVGSTGNSSGPHLHFEVRVSPGEYSNRVNPMGYLP